MRKWGSKKHLTAAGVAAAIAVAAAVMSGASGVSGLFEPKNFSRFQNHKNSDEYDYVAGEGEDADLADQNKNGEDGSGNEDQLLTLAQEQLLEDTDTQGNLESENSATLGRADNSNASSEDQKKNGIQFVNSSPNSNTNVRPGSNGKQTDGSGSGNGNSGNGNNQGNHSSDPSGDSDNNQNSGDKNDNSNGGGGTQNPSDDNKESETPATSDNGKDPDETETPSTLKKIPQSWLEQTENEAGNEYLDTESVYHGFVEDTYLELTGEQKQQIQEWIFEQKSAEDLTFSELTTQIRQALRMQVQYTERPQAVPSGQNFMPWLLQDYKKGNAVYFATAAVLSYRAASYPARYVEGYHLSDQEAGQMETTGEKEARLASKNAYAWVEVYVNGIGWMPVEVVPGMYVESGRNV